MNRQIRIYIMALCLLCSAPCCGAAAEKAVSTFSVSLKEALDIAFKNNKDIRIQEEEVNAARSGIEGARSVFFPQLNANAGYKHNSFVLPLSQSANAKKDPGIFTGYKNDYTMGAEVDQNLYSGGANIANLRQAQIQLKIQEETLAAEKLDIEFEVKRLYHGLLLAHETERIAQELVDQAQSHYEDVKKKYEQGTASKFDLLQSKVHVSKVTPELIKAKNAVNLIAAELKKALGLKMADEVILTDKLLYNSIEIKEEKFLETAYLDKPEMTLLALGVDISKWAIESAKAGWRPQVNAAFDYNYRAGEISELTNNRHNSWNAGVSVRVPLFDGFSTKAKVDEAKTHYAKANLAKENLVDQIAVDIRQACLDLKQAQEVINSQKESIEEAREALKIAGVSYDNGQGTNLDVLDAQVSLGQVEKNLSEGIYDYIMAEAFLDRSMGKSVIPVPQEKTEKGAHHEKKD